MLTAAKQTTGWSSCPRCSRRARKGQAFCELCGLALQTTAGQAEEETRSAYRCDGCGASVLVPEGQRTATCTFCGTPYVRVGELGVDRFAPDFVLPFSVTKGEAEAAWRDWLRRGGWFCPGDLRGRGILSRLHGVYIPFWSFSMRSESSWEARIGEYWYETVTESYTVHEHGKLVRKTRTRRVRHTEWYPLSGLFHQFHFQYLVAASRGITQELAESIQPFPVAESTRYAPHFLAGWLCEEYVMEREEAERLSEEEFRRREQRDIADFLPGDCHDDLSISTRFQDVGADLVLLPIWILAYIYGGRTYRFVLNGATGTHHGKRPVSKVRVALCVGAIMGLILLVVFLFALLLRGG